METDDLPDNHESQLVRDLQSKIRYLEEENRKLRRDASKAQSLSYSRMVDAVLDGLCAGGLI